MSVTLRALCVQLPLDWRERRRASAHRGRNSKKALRKVTIGIDKLTLREVVLSQLPNGSVGKQLPESKTHFGVKKSPRRRSKRNTGATFSLKRDRTSHACANELVSFPIRTLSNPLVSVGGGGLSPASCLLDRPCYGAPGHFTAAEEKVVADILSRRRACTAGFCSLRAGPFS